MAIDPVCGMNVDPAKAAGESAYRGEMYYFCSKRCLHSFRADPEQFFGVKNSAHAMHEHGHTHHAAVPAKADVGKEQRPKPVTKAAL